MFGTPFCLLDELSVEMQNRRAFVDFLQGLLNLNPIERWSPQQAKLHPFITGEKFTEAFKPPIAPKNASNLPNTIPRTVSPTTPSANSLPPSPNTQQQRSPMVQSPASYGMQPQPTSSM